MLTRLANGTLSHKNGSLRYTLHKKAYETLEKGGFEASVVCPEDVDPNEWIAVHTIDFYNDINMIFCVVQDECTEYSCPIMSAGENYEFLWTDRYKYRKPTRLPARIYIDYLLNWIVRLLEDDTLFPVVPDVPFPRNYLEKVRSIFRRIFRVYAHIYYSHYTLTTQLDLKEQFDFSLTHFLYFVDQFHLIETIDLRPLSELIPKLAPTLRISKELMELDEHDQMDVSTGVQHEYGNERRIVMMTSSTVQPFGGIKVESLESSYTSGQSSRNGTSNQGSVSSSELYSNPRNIDVPRQRLMTVHEANGVMSSGEIELTSHASSSSKIYERPMEEETISPEQPYHSTHQSYTDSIGQSYASSIDQSYTDSIHQSYADSIHQSYADSIHQSYADSIHQSCTDSIHQSYNNSINQSYANPLHQSPIQTLIHAEPIDNQMRMPDLSLIEDDLYGDQSDSDVDELNVRDEDDDDV